MVDLRTHGLALSATAACVATGCGSPVDVGTNRAVVVAQGLTPAAVARRVGSRGTVLFNDARGGRRAEAIAYRIGLLNLPCVVLYIDGHLNKVSQWEDETATTVVVGIGRQRLSGASGTLRPDALLDVEADLLSAPGETTDLERPPRVRTRMNAEDVAFAEGFLPLFVIASPILVPVAIAQSLMTRTAADVPLGKSVGDVDRVLGKPDRTWPELAGNQGEWRRYQRHFGDDPLANDGPIHVLFRGGHAVAAFGPGLASGLGY